MNEEPTSNIESPYVKFFEKMDNRKIKPKENIIQKWSKEVKAMTEIEDDNIRHKKQMSLVNEILNYLYNEPDN